jgi:hypothetical protein
MDDPPSSVGLDLAAPLANVLLTVDLDVAEDKLRPLLLDLGLLELALVVVLVRVEDASRPAWKGRDGAWRPGGEVDRSGGGSGGRAGSDGRVVVRAAVRMVRVGRDSGDGPLEAELGRRERDAKERGVGCRPAMGVCDQPWSPERRKAWGTENVKDAR